MTRSPVRSGTPCPADALADSIARVGSPLCVGLDPVLEQLPFPAGSEAADAIGEFSTNVLDAVTGAACAVKFQSACYERYGWRGIRALESAMAHARSLGFVVVLDAKRGDIGISAAHYAAAARNAGAHFVTVNGYLGPSGIEPFVQDGLGAFVLVRTSNPDSSLVQSRLGEDGRSVAESMASLVAELGRSRMGVCGLSSLGAVVGATHADEGSALRAHMPNQIFLVPGLGAQGAKPQSVRRLVRPGEPVERMGVLVTASRSIIYPEKKIGDWREAVAASAKEHAREISEALRAG